MALDRIDGLGSYDRTSGSNNKKVQGREGAEDTASFTLLKDEAQGVIYEPGRPEQTRPKTLAEVNEEIAKEEAAAARANLHSRFDGPGVAVELSTDGIQKQEQTRPPSILDIFRDAFRAIGAFFSGIWNGGAEAEARARQQAVEETAEADDAETAVLDRDNSPEAAVAFLADYGGGHLAKNSDLLTQYDRSGHIISLDPSDKRRILQGEGRVRRY